MDAEKIFETALLIRKVEERISFEYAKQKIRCPVHLSIGQEVTSAIFSAAFKPGDTAISTHRAHAHYLAMGGDINRMIAEIYGKVTGCCRGRGGSMHLVDKSVGFLGSSAIVGNSIPIGVGIALSHKQAKNKSVNYIFLGDAAVEEGVFYESANFATIHKIPTVFICENNFYSVYTNLDTRQPSGRKIHQVASAIGLESKKIETNDPMQALNEMSHMISFARLGHGPVFIEVETYRFLEHCGPNLDNELNYRPSTEIEHWKKLDFVNSIYNFASINEISEFRINEIAQRITKKIDEAFYKASRDPFPTLMDSLSDVYAGP
jgi:pyruvate dehydrogenase E1 component alpha subunit